MNNQPKDIQIKTCPNCGTNLEHHVDDQDSSCPDQWWECPKCGYEEQ